MQLTVVGAVDLAHAAGADAFEDLVRSQARPRSERTRRRTRVLPVRDEPGGVFECAPVEEGFGVGPAVGVEKAQHFFAESRVFPARRIQRRRALVLLQAAQLFEQIARPLEIFGRHGEAGKSGCRRE